MTRLALCVLVWSPCVMLVAQEPKKQPSEFEGAWQEPAMPGEDPAMRYRITFAGDKVTIHHREQVLTGTVVVSSDFRQLRVTMTIANVEGKGSHVKGTYVGIYEVAKDCVSFHFNPEPVRSQTGPKLPEGATLLEAIKSGAEIELDRGTLRLAPVTLTLHKVAK